MSWTSHGQVMDRSWTVYVKRTSSVRKPSERWMEDMVQIQRTLRCNPVLIPIPFAPVTILDPGAHQPVEADQSLP